jgi:hypothetical protein
MTPEALLSELCNFPTPIDSSQEVLPPTSRLSRIDVEDPLDGTSNAGSISPRPDEAEHWLRIRSHRTSGRTGLAAGRPFWYWWFLGHVLWCPTSEIFSRQIHQADSYSCHTFPRYELPPVLVPLA